MEKNIRIESKQDLLTFIGSKRALIYAVCLAYTDKSKEEVEDLYQEIVCKLFEAFDKYKEENKFFAWFYTIVVNTAINHYRYEKRRLKFVRGDKALQQYIYEPLEEIDDNDRFKRIMDGLSLKDKAIMTLYMDNYSPKEIASIVGISYSNVTTKVSRLKKTLRKIYERINILI